jgi:hypothetical protein
MVSSVLCKQNVGVEVFRSFNVIAGAGNCLKRLSLKNIDNKKTPARLAFWVSLRN